MTHDNKRIKIILLLLIHSLTNSAIYRTSNWEQSNSIGDRWVENCEVCECDRVARRDWQFTCGKSPPLARSRQPQWSRSPTQFEHGHSPTLSADSLSSGCALLCLTQHYTTQLNVSNMPTDHRHRRTNSLARKCERPGSKLAAQQSGQVILVSISISGPQQIKRRRGRRRRRQSGKEASKRQVSSKQKQWVQFTGKFVASMTLVEPPLCRWPPPPQVSFRLWSMEAKLQSSS